jgi:hypothetical protein
MLLVLVVACRTTTPCDAPHCAEACEQAEAELSALVPPGGDLLSAQEVRVLAPELAEIRAGIRLPEDALQICHGTTSCEAPLAVEDARPPEGDYVVVGRVIVPKIGTWRVAFWKVCTRDGVEIERSGGPMPIRAVPGKDVVDLGVLDRLHLGPRRSTSHETACAYTLRADEGTPHETKRLLNIPAATH